MKRFVVYVDTGNLTKDKSDLYVQNVKADFESQNFFEIGEKVVYIPIRGEFSKTRIEVIPD
jgi:hypothetical protein